MHKAAQSSLDRSLGLDQDGAQLFAKAVSAGEASRLAERLVDVVVDRPGVRLRIGQLPVFNKTFEVAASILGSGARPVRAVLFDKSAAMNWNLGWHQDRTIVVRERLDVPDFGPWSKKAGLQHVEPPFEVIERMVTLRLHLDPVDHDDAPLIIAPGSHRLGKIAVDKVAEIAVSLEPVSCLAEAGDIWLYSTPILHASQPAARPRRRRVLQIDYAGEDLPGGLVWLGI